MTPEQQKLCDLIDGHCAAMKAQVLDPSVKIEWSYSGSEWLPRKGSIISPEKCWARLAPIPRLIPLDQSDFLGDRRITHIRYGNLSCLVSATSDTTVFFFDYSFPYDFIKNEGLECSRDWGKSFGPCSKPEASK